jgi:ribosomal protein L39E
VPEAQKNLGKKKKSALLRAIEQNRACPPFCLAGTVRLPCGKARKEPALTRQRGAAFAW